MTIDPNETQKKGFSFKMTTKSAKSAVFVPLPHLIQYQAVEQDRTLLPKPLMFREGFWHDRK